MNEPTLKQKIFAHRQSIAWSLALVWAAFIFVFSSIEGSELTEWMKSWSSMAHLGEYLVLGVLVNGALNMPWRSNMATTLISIIIVAVFGFTDEIHQMFVAGRVPSIDDWIIDAVGGAIGTIVSTWFLITYRRLSGLREKRRRHGHEARDEGLTKNRLS